MFLFGHTGIPLGVIWLSHKAVTGAGFNLSRRKPDQSIADKSVPQLTGNPSQIGSYDTWIDYRLILLGSMLPDIIDKPLGTWLLRDTLSNGRVFGHTLLFAVLLAAGGIYLYLSRRRRGLLSLSLGSVAHLALDEMWLELGALLWPIFGWSFGRAVVSGWLGRALTALYTEPSVYIPELIGALLLALFLFNLIRKGKLNRFLRTGEAD